VRRHIHDAECQADLPAQAGISFRTAYKSRARYLSGGRPALLGRCSGRRTQRRTLDPQQLQQAVDLRHQCFTLSRIARLLAAPLSTMDLNLKAMGLGRLKYLKPPVPVCRHQWEQPGDLIHVGIKQLVRFSGVGDRITGDRRLGFRAVRYAKSLRRHR